MLHIFSHIKSLYKDQNCTCILIIYWTTKNNFKWKHQEVHKGKKIIEDLKEDENVLQNIKLIQDLLSIN